ncbi:alpha/beta fold hydrolase [Flavobacterium sp.]|jgi:pimeloyl-ACP methyl ester carboxylesterase|uniref:alpha/beta fold hydrolase n=1 Tax=Flavobacterium sp. TaxID=239 RepID=UPI0037BE23B5
MKTKLSLTIVFLFGMFFQTKTNAQDLTLIAKPRSADVKNLSIIDSLQIYSQLKTANKKTTLGQTELPYPIIFIHGLNSNSKVWIDLGLQLVNEGLSFGGRIDFSLNDDNNNSTSNKNIYPTAGADIALFTNSATDLSVGDFYFLNFDINNNGELYTSDDGSPFNDMLSNEASIVKQGIALKYAIQIVLQKTGRDKVIIMGHSMGGLCGREYLQNPSIWTEPNVNHHVAKLITTGTPHGGYTGTNVSLTGIDSSSEAYRDLRKEYTWSGSVGAYLYGGIENQTNIDNSAFSDFYNVDVNCNGINGDNTMIVGLNQKTLPATLDYSYIVGICTNCQLLQGLTIEGDGIVRRENANLNNFYNLPTPVNEFIYTAAQIGAKGLHSELPQAIPVNFQGLDEPNFFNLAYQLTIGNTYKGFITPQSIASINDYDDYKFLVNMNNQVNLLVNNTLSFSIYARIFDSNYNQVGQTLTINSGSNNFSQSLPIGLYYLQIYGAPTSTSYLNPYTFSLSNTLSNPDFTSDNSLKIFPNPTTSKVFFDNSIEKFETATVVNYLGQVVSETKFDSFTTNQEIDLSSFTAGVYLVKFTNNDKSITQKIVKE